MTVLRELKHPLHMQLHNKNLQIIKQNSLSMHLLTTLSTIPPNLNRGIGRKFKVERPSYKIKVMANHFAHHDLGHSNIISCCREPTDSIFSTLHLKMKIYFWNCMTTLYRNIHAVAASLYVWPSLVVLLL